MAGFFSSVSFSLLWAVLHLTNQQNLFSV